jgi:predicted enzyme related to lactoylglutathione lyase
MAAVGWFRDLVIDADDMDALADFWCAVLGVKVAERYDDFLALEMDKGGCYFGIQPVSKERGSDVPARGLRVRPDVEVEDLDVATQQIEELGGTLVKVVHEAAGDTHHLMADPEGNEFCIVKPPPYPLGSAPGT